MATGLLAIVASIALIVVSMLWPWSAGGCVAYLFGVIGVCSSPHVTVIHLLQAVDNGGDNGSDNGGDTGGDRE